MPVRRSTDTAAPSGPVPMAFEAATIAPTWSPGLASSGTVTVIGSVSCVPACRVMSRLGRVIQEPTSSGASSPGRMSNSPCSLLKASVAYTSKFRGTLP